MLKAINKKREKVFAKDLIEKDRGKFTCPNCKSKVILILPKKKINHFRHYNSESCESEPETEEHLQMKTFFYLKMIELGFKNVDTEFKIGNRIADVYAEKNRLKYIIECQCSPISLDEINQRNKDYMEKYSCYVLWSFGKKFWKFNFINHNFKIPDSLFYGWSKFEFYSFIEGDLVKINYKRAKRGVKEFTNFSTGETHGGYFKYYSKQYMITQSLIKKFKIKPYKCYNQKRIKLCEKRQKSI